MANSLISMIKGNSTLINNTEVLNGQVLFDTDEKSILLDDNNTRSEYCGADKSNKNLASIENGTTASKGYSAGSYVVWKGQLYKVLKQINSGTAFVVGTNIALDTVGTELTRINSALPDKQNKSWTVLVHGQPYETNFFYDFSQFDELYVEIDDNGYHPFMIAVARLDNNVLEYTDGVVHVKMSIGVAFVVTSGSMTIYAR